MIPGIAGQLIPVACLELSLDSAACLTGTAASRVTKAHRDLRRWRDLTAAMGPASSLRTLSEVAAGPLARILGYEPAGVHDSAGAVLTLDLLTAGNRVPCVVCAWGVRHDRFWRDAAMAGRARGCRWALLFNGTHLRLMDAAGSRLQRFIEFDLAVAAGDERCFAALWLSARADAVGSSAVDDSNGLNALVGRADAFATGVCRSLRDGVLAASGHVVTALAAHPARARGAVAKEAELDGPFEQTLTVVYRLLFLLFAESRGLVPMWHPVYRQSYSVEALGAAAQRGRSAGLWDALRAISRLAHAGCRTSGLTVTPFNGRLFDAARLPLIERRNLDDDAARQAVIALTTRVSDVHRGREPISYRDLGVEQLGAVYETLLDYRPRRTTAPGHGGRTAVVLERGSDARKASGSFYTPQPLARYLVSRTLEPLVRDRRPEDILSLKVVDPAAGSGAFLVEACQYLASAYEDALIATGACLSEDIGPSDRADIRRVIAERCLFGVDANPMAVQLARLSLWLVTLAWNKPLSFLDHHIRAGDSLIGAWLSSLGRPPAPVRRKGEVATLPLFDDDQFAGAARAALPVRLSLAGPSDTLDQVRAKERALERLEGPDSELTGWRRVADLWCAQWLGDTPAPPASAFRALAELARRGRGDLPTHVARASLERASATARARRFFHWELEFPEVFFDTAGRRRPAAGFDAVIGNPPWDMLRADSGPTDGRARVRDSLDRVRRFVREAGIYEAQSDGHANRYQLFLERSVALLREGGRLGLVLPGGLATDHGSARLRRLLFARCAVDGFVGFDNRRAVFPIHRSVRFVLLTATRGQATRRFGVRLGEVDPAILDQAHDDGRHPFPLELSVDLLVRLSGSGLAVPFLRHAHDLAIAERVASLFPPLGSAAGWGLHFGRELNATDDGPLFRDRGAGLPVIDGRQIDPFTVRTSAAVRAISRTDATRRLGDRWRLPRLAYRDVASATNRLTLIAGLLPRGAVSTHTVFCLRTPLPLRSQYFLCGLFNSFVVNHLVRLWVTTHVTTDIVERLPLPRRSDAPAAFVEIAAASRRLIRGGPPHPPHVLARLNARVAALFQLSHSEFAHVLDAFPLVPEAERERALAAYRSMS